MCCEIILNNNSCVTAQITLTCPQQAGHRCNAESLWGALQRLSTLLFGPNNAYLNPRGMKSLKAFNLHCYPSFLVSALMTLRWLICAGIQKEWMDFCAKKRMMTMAKSPHLTLDLPRELPSSLQRCHQLQGEGQVGLAMKEARRKPCCLEDSTPHGSPGHDPLGLSHQLALMGRHGVLGPDFAGAAAFWIWGCHKQSGHSSQLVLQLCCCKQHFSSWTLAREGDPTKWVGFYVCPDTVVYILEDKSQALRSNQHQPQPSNLTWDVQGRRGKRAMKHSEIVCASRE